MKKSANIRSPRGIVVDKAGTLYIAASYDDIICRIKKHYLIGASISTLAGTELSNGYTDGAGKFARFDQPDGLAIDKEGFIYVADRDNQLIRKISPNGSVKTIAGHAKVSGYIDGPVDSALFKNPTALAVDHLGNIYVADTGNHVVRKISIKGIVSTIVGRPDQVGFVPGELPGVLSDPRALAIYNSTLYIIMNNGVAVVRNLP